MEWLEASEMRAFFSALDSGLGRHTERHLFL
jgi:hypothetical protein